MAAAQVDATAIKSAALKTIIQPVQTFSAPCGAYRQGKRKKEPKTDDRQCCPEREAKRYRESGMLRAESCQTRHGVPRTGKVNENRRMSRARAVNKKSRIEKTIRSGITLFIHRMYAGHVRRPRGRFLTVQAGLLTFGSTY